MSNKMKSITTQAEAIKAFEPLNPNIAGKFTQEEKKLAYERLLNLIRVLLPE